MGKGGVRRQSEVRGRGTLGKAYSGGKETRKIAAVLARMTCSSEANARPTRFAPVAASRGDRGPSN